MESSKIKWIILIAIIVLGIFVFYNYEKWKGQDSIKPIKDFIIKKDIPNSEEEIVDDCKGLTISQTSECLLENVKTFYIYNTSRNYYITPSLERLKEDGGDCEDFSVFYKNLAIKLGFNSEVRSYEGIKDVMVAHQWAVIWDDENYCVLDLIKKVQCRGRMRMLEK